MRVQYHDKRVPRYATEREVQAKYETGLSGTQTSGRVVFGGIEPRPDGGLFRNASYRALLVFLRKRDERFDDSVGNLSIAVSRFSVSVVACGARPSPTNLGGRCSRAFRRPLSGRGVRAGSRRVRNYETKPNTAREFTVLILSGWEVLYSLQEAFGDAKRGPARQGLQFSGSQRSLGATS